jgi:hypothetical protein
MVLETLSQKNPTQKRADGVAQGVGPEFKPQCHTNTHIHTHTQIILESIIQAEIKENKGEERNLPYRISSYSHKYTLIKGLELTA